MEKRRDGRLYGCSWTPAAGSDNGKQDASTVEQMWRLKKEKCRNRGKMQDGDGMRGEEEE